MTEPHQQDAKLGKCPACGASAMKAKLHCQLRACSWLDCRCGRIFTVDIDSREGNR